MYCFLKKLNGAFLKKYESKRKKRLKIIFTQICVLFFLFKILIVYIN